MPVKLTWQRIIGRNLSFSISRSPFVLVCFRATLVRYVGTGSVVDAFSATTQLERPLLRSQFEASIQDLLEPLSFLRLSV
jgi:hypothetical protein